MQQPGLGAGDIQKDQEGGRLSPKLPILGFLNWDKIRKLWDKAINEVGLFVFFQEAGQEINIFDSQAGQTFEQRVPPAT